MAEVNTDGGGHKEKGKKVKQKKVNLRVDFTPMVDMNMLLITFFMFCTSLSKPQTMEINMPSRDKVTEEEQDKIKASEAITIIMGGDNKVFYYEGLLEDATAYEDPNFLKESDYSSDGLRAMLLRRNRVANEKIRLLNEEKLATNMPDSIFNKEKLLFYKEPGTPKVLIKAMNEIVIDEQNTIPSPTYKNIIDVLDEMAICNIGVYAIVDIQEGDEFLVKKYLGLLPTEEE